MCNSDAMNAQPISGHNLSTTWTHCQLRYMHMTAQQISIILGTRTVYIASLGGVTLANDPTLQWILIVANMVNCYKFNLPMNQVYVHKHTVHTKMHVMMTLLAHTTVHVGYFLSSLKAHDVYIHVWYAAGMRFICFLHTHTTTYIYKTSSWYSERVHT